MVEYTICFYKQKTQVPIYLQILEYDSLSIHAKYIPNPGAHLYSFAHLAW